VPEQKRVNKWLYYITDCLKGKLKSFNYSVSSHEFQWPFVKKGIRLAHMTFVFHNLIKIWCLLDNMRQMQPETLPKNSNFLPVYKISSFKITLPKTLQLKTLDFLQQTITMNENAQWQMIKDSVLFSLSSGFSVSLFHFYLKKKSTRSVLFCISSFFSLHRSLYLLLAYCLYWR
jgi:hypothetical protein